MNITVTSDNNIQLDIDTALMVMDYLDDLQGYYRTEHNYDSAMDVAKLDNLVDGLNDAIVMAEKNEDIGGSKEKESRQWLIKSDDGQEIRFEGIEVARVSSKRERNPRWAELALYRSVNGNLIAVTEGHSSVKGERTRKKAIVIPEAEKDRLFDFFGSEELALKLYPAANLYRRVEV